MIGKIVGMYMCTIGFGIICFCAAYLISKELIKCDNLASRLVWYVLALIAFIYTVPFIGIIGSAIVSVYFMDECVDLARYWGITTYVIGFLMMLSSIPVAKWVIIPLVEEKKIRLVEEEFGKDSDYAKYLRRKKSKKGR